MKDGKRYNNLSGELKRILGEKTGKLSIDGGFTCPNRDGHLGDKGCLFCGERGAGEFTIETLEIAEQIKNQMNIARRKWNVNKFIAYFQSFTNTYAPLEKLKELYEKALDQEGVAGLAIATRPDCLPTQVLDYLEELNKRTFLWVELGLQTIHPESHRLLRTGYGLKTYEDAIYELKKRGIKVVTHLILGLPGETFDQMIESVKYVAGTSTWGIKLHSLYIQRDTDLCTMYLEEPFSIMTLDEYVSLIGKALTILPEDMVIHRLTGDGDKSLLFLPEWGKNKLAVISAIDKYLKENDIWQGQSFKL